MGSSRVGRASDCQCRQSGIRGAAGEAVLIKYINFFSSYFSRSRRDMWRRCTNPPPGFSPSESRASTSPRPGPSTSRGGPMRSPPDGHVTRNPPTNQRCVTWQRTPAACQPGILGWSRDNLNSDQSEGMAVSHNSGPMGGPSLTLVTDQHEAFFWWSEGWTGVLWIYWNHFVISWDYSVFFSFTLQPVRTSICRLQEASLCGGSFQFSVSSFFSSFLCREFMGTLFFM
jgi:hypothetical protein